MHIIKHFKTITRHRHEVIKNCFRAGIGIQGLFHDLSKYSLSEFKTGARYYMGNKSPNDKERSLYGYSKAWIHHKGRNKHHFEYWYDYDLVTKEIIPVKMPMNYMKEMLCDRIAASKVYNGNSYNDNHPLEYFYNSKASKYMHPENSRMLEEWLVYLSRNGEDELFKIIRELK